MIMPSRRPLLPLSLLVFSIAIILNLLGSLLLFSTENGREMLWAEKHSQWGLLFCLGALLFQLIPTQTMLRTTAALYLLSMLLLLLAEFTGRMAMGAQRWVQLGPFSMQPSELAKISTIVTVAKYFHLRPLSHITSWKNLLYPMIVTALPVCLILRQPNLGTSLVVCGCSFIILFYAGFEWRKIMLIAALCLAVAPILWHGFLHDYQKQRIMTFINPAADKFGAGYNVLQSQIAIGSGGLYGLGLTRGTQNVHNFLPEKHTDFIFAVLAEEFGYLGVMVTLLLYSILIFSMILIANLTRIHFDKLVVGGIGFMLFAHVFINMAMISGLLPVVGIPLPFLSYGRSNLLISWIGVGLVLRASRFAETR